MTNYNTLEKSTLETKETLVSHTCGSCNKCGINENKTNNDMYLYKHAPLEHVLGLESTFQGYWFNEFVVVLCFLIGAHPS